MPIQSALLAAQRQVEALPARVAHIVEIARIGAGRDELDVIAVDGVEYIGAPRQPLIRKIAPYAYLRRSGHHLPQIRIAGERVRQSAGRCGIGTAEFDDGWRAARLVVV